jgi:hypothetical protein
MTCECGELKIDGKCPVCDVKLKRPGVRALHLQSTLRQRERVSERPPLPKKAANAGFVHFCEERKIVPWSPPIVQRRRKRR